MTATGQSTDAANAAAIDNEAADNGALDFSAAGARLAQWQRNAARAHPKDAGALIQNAGHHLTLLKAFGATQYLADLCLAYPDAVIAALNDGPAAVIAQAARDLMTLDRGAGDAAALYEALKPLKQRSDLAIGLAELSGDWGEGRAASARTDVAERMVEASVKWLARSAYRRGEARSKDKNAATKGVFVLASGDFATEETAYFGPLDLVIIYDGDGMKDAGAATPERTFMRMGTELRQALEGPPGGKPLYAPRAPVVTGLAGTPLVVSVAEVLAALDEDGAGEARAWFAEARVVAGDRTAGGAFMEQLVARLWEGDLAAEETAAMLAAGAKPETGGDPCAAHDRVARLCRLTLGRGRPIFRSASARAVFETAAELQALDGAAAERLAAGADLVRAARARAQLIRGAWASASTDGAEARALAVLCGFRDEEEFARSLEGARAEAENALRSILTPAEDLFTETPAPEPAKDVANLEMLGFKDGAALSSVIDAWLRKAAPAGGTTPARLSAVAPGLITAFGECQAPEKAVSLFDAFVTVLPKHSDVFGRLREAPQLQQTIVDFFGCMPATARHMLETEEDAAGLLEPHGDETPQTVDEWRTRFAPPWTGGDAPQPAEVGAWVKREVARTAFYAVGGDIGYDLAAAVSADVHKSAVAALFDNAAKDIAAADHIAVIAQGDLGDGALPPGAPCRLNFVTTAESGAEADAFAAGLVAALEDAKTGPGLTIDVTHRPEGVSGPLVPTLDRYKQYYDMEAVATEQTGLFAMRPIAGGEAACEAVSETLAALMSGPRKAELLLRDADRGRMRLQRHVRALSAFDVRRIEGGLDDLNLIIGGLVLKHAAAHPYILTPSTDESLDALARANLIDAAHGEELKAARGFWLSLLTAEALSDWRDPSTQTPSVRLSAQFAKAAGVEDFAQVEPLIAGYAERVNVLYNHLILGREASPAGAPGRTAPRMGAGR